MLESIGTSRSTDMACGRSPLPDFLYSATGRISYHSRLASDGAARQNFGEEIGEGHLPQKLLVCNA